MTGPFLPEHAPMARRALELAQREAEHLRYTLTTLFALPITPQWVIELASFPERAEKVDAFVARFGRLQDHLGEKVLPRFAALLGEPRRSLLDTLAFAERMGWIDDAQAFVVARRLRNQLIHEYLIDPGQFFDALLQARAAAYQLMEVIERLEHFARALGLIPR